jgi:hypothetical protein
VVAVEVDADTAAAEVVDADTAEVAAVAEDMVAVAVSVGEAATRVDSRGAPGATIRIRTGRVPASARTHSNSNDSGALAEMPPLGGIFIFMTRTSTLSGL